MELPICLIDNHWVSKRGWKWIFWWNIRLHLFYCLRWTIIINSEMIERRMKRWKGKLFSSIPCLFCLFAILRGICRKYFSDPTKDSTSLRCFHRERCSRVELELKSAWEEFNSFKIFWCKKICSGIQKFEMLFNNFSFIYVNI